MQDRKMRLGKLPLSLWLMLQPPLMVTAIYIDQILRECDILGRMLFLFSKLIDTNEEALLKQALEMSMGQEPADDDGEESGQTSTTIPDFSAMTEEEQIAYAMQMSLASESGKF